MIEKSMDQDFPPDAAKTFTRISQIDTDLIGVNPRNPRKSSSSIPLPAERRTLARKYIRNASDLRHGWREGRRGTSDTAIQADTQPKQTSVVHKVRVEPSHDDPEHQHSDNEVGQQKGVDGAQGWVAVAVIAIEHP